MMVTVSAGFGSCRVGVVMRGPVCGLPYERARFGQGDDHGHETGRSVRNRQTYEHLFDSVDDVTVGAATRHRPWPGPG